jgi:cell division protein FtsB
VLRPRHKRYALLAASVAIAAVFGAVVGAATTGGFSKSAAVSAAGVEENKAMQQSVARLAKEITSLKAGLEATNKSAHSQIAKLSERLSRGGADITGSITPPQTVASPAPVPTPRPAPRGAETHPTRSSILADWSIRETRGGYVYVQGHGDVYQVVPGAPLPGVGPVEQIKRQDGRWVVVTPKGIIVSMRDRRYFEQF